MQIIELEDTITVTDWNAEEWLALDLTQYPDTSTIEFNEQVDVSVVQQNDGGRELSYKERKVYHSQYLEGGGFMCWPTAEHFPILLPRLG